MPTRRLGRVARWAIGGLKPNQRQRLTREGWGYLVIWLALLAIGLYQQSNLVLLIAGLAAGPLAGSVLLSASMVRRVTPSRRLAPFVFEGDPLVIDYTLENGRKRTAALAMLLEDELNPVERVLPEAARLSPRVWFPRVAGADRLRLRAGRGTGRVGAVTVSATSSW